MEKNIKLFNQFANHLADEARKISMFYFKKKIKINNKNKNDFDPVTVADIGVQKKINKLINKQFTNHSILGEEDSIIKDACFKTFGCGSAIAASSLATEWVKGQTLDEATTINNTEIVEELSLPPVKIHCSVLAEDAIKGAIADYKSKHETI